MKIVSKNTEAAGLRFPELYLRGFSFGLPSLVRGLPVLVGQSKITYQLYSSFLLSQPIQSRCEVNHIPVCPAAEAVVTPVQLHAGGLVVVERTASHPVSSHPDSVVFRSLPGSHRLLDCFKYIQIISS